MKILEDAKDLLTKKVSSGESLELRDAVTAFERTHSLQTLFAEIEAHARRNRVDALKILSDVLTLLLRYKKDVTKDSFVVQNLNRALQSSNAVLQKMALSVLKSQPAENVGVFLPTLVSLTLISDDAEDVADVVLKFAKDLKTLLETVRKALNDTIRKDSVAFTRALHLLVRLCKSKTFCLSILNSGEELGLIFKSVSGSDPLLVLSIIEMLPELFALESDEEIVSRMSTWFRDSNLMTTLLSYACCSGKKKMNDDDAFANLYEAPSLRIVTHVLALDRGMKLFGVQTHQTILNRLKHVICIGHDDDAVSNAALESIKMYCNKCDETIWKTLENEISGVFEGVTKLARGRKVKDLAAAAGLRTIASLLESMKTLEDSSKVVSKLYDSIGGAVHLLKVVHTSFEVSHQHAACEVLCACSKHDVLLKRMLTESDGFRSYLRKIAFSTSTDLRVRDWAICTVVHIMQNKSSRSMVEGMCDEDFVKDLCNIMDVAAGKKRAPVSEPEFRVKNVV